MEYHGEQLNPNSVMVNGYTMGNLALAAQRLREYNVMRVHLEPGDATRYTLWFSVIGTDMLVTRETGGVEGWSTVRLNPFVTHCSEYEVVRLANGNEHTLKVLQWWISLLLYEMNH